MAFDLDYHATDTACDFHNDDSFVRLLFGPVGCGKSVACCVEPLLRGLAQPPGNDGIRRTRGAVIRNCYDDQTEVLTEHRGFVFFKDLKPDDKVAMLQDDRLVYVLPSLYYTAPYSGEMIHFENEGVDFCVTPDHKMYASKLHTRKKVWKDYDLIKAEEIFGSGMYRVKRDVKWIGVNVRDYSLKMFEFFGFWFAEGCAYAHKSRTDGYTRTHCIITQVNNDGIHYARNLLESLGLPYSEIVNGSAINFRISYNDKTKILIDELTIFGKSTQKYLPQWLKDAPADCLNAFLEGFIKGDGHIRKDSITTTAYTSSVSLANDLQEVAFKAGKVANLSVRDRRHQVDRAIVATEKEYTLTFVNEAKYQPALKVQGYAKKYRGWHKEKYDGLVYCIEVPTHVIYVRRNGKAFWCSQTYPELKSTTIKTWLSWYPEAKFGKIRWDSPITQLMKFNDVEIEVFFMPMDSIDDVDKLMSLELTWAYINELQFINKKIFKICQQRVNRFPSKKDGAPIKWAGVFADTNPPDTDHWIYKLFEEHLPTNHKLFHYESPLIKLDEVPKDGREHAISMSHSSYENNPVDYREIQNDPNYWLNLVPGMTDEEIKVNMMGEYGIMIDGRPVHATYNDSIHYFGKVLEADPKIELGLGFDFGLCYSDDTEVLTEGGWKLFKDVDECLDTVATRNPDTGEMTYTKINFKTEYDYEGEMLEWANDSINFCVTPDHRVPFTYRDTPGKVQFKAAKWLADNHGGHHYVDVVSDWHGKIEKDKMLFGMDAYTFSQLMGLYLSEGCVTVTGNSHRISIYQNNQNPVMQEILDRTHMDWRYGSQSWRTTDNVLGAYLHSFGLAHDKYVPDIIKEMPKEYIKAFIYAYTMGDGHIRTRRNGSVEHTVFTVSKSMADDFQELAQKAGWNSSLRKVKPQTSIITEDGQERSITNNGGYSITFKKRAKRAELLSANFKRIDYDGKIYCLNVPFHTLYVRRNGKPSWNGNTPACAIVQLNPLGQLQVIDELWTEDMDLRDFAANMVIPHLDRYYPFWRKNYYCASDPAGTTPSQTDGRACEDILFELGIRSHSAADNNSPTPRRDGLKYFLSRLTGGQPGCLVSSKCPMIRKGLMGNFQYAKMKVVGREQYHEKPLKNIFSHICEALEYIAMTYSSEHKKPKPTPMKSSKIRQVPFMAL